MMMDTCERSESSSLLGIECKDTKESTSTKATTTTIMALTNQGEKTEPGMQEDGQCEAGEKLTKACLSDDMVSEGQREDIAQSDVDESTNGDKRNRRCTSSCGKGTPENLSKGGVTVKQRGSNTSEAKSNGIGRTSVYSDIKLPVESSSPSSKAESNVGSSDGFSQNRKRKRTIGEANGREIEVKLANERSGKRQNAPLHHEICNEDDEDDHYGVHDDNTVPKLISSRESDIERDGDVEGEGEGEGEVDRERDGDGERFESSRSNARSRKSRRKSRRRSGRNLEYSTTTTPGSTTLTSTGTTNGGSNDGSTRLSEIDEVLDEEIDVDEATNQASDEARRKQAMISLGDIEKHFTAFRDRHLSEQIDRISHELQLLHESKLLHPDYISMVRCIDDRKAEKLKYESNLRKFKMNALKIRNIAEKWQLLGQYFQEVREARERALESGYRHYFALERDLMEWGSDEITKHDDGEFRRDRCRLLHLQMRLGSATSDYPFSSMLEGLCDEEIDHDLRVFGLTS